ncbi:2-nitropropane dioxygenase [Pholiota molesta]|nr:2-nitropropane dioxygenase [Pholiota molesta]
MEQNTPIQTPFTKLLGALAASVTLGGGFGFLAAGYDAPDWLRKEISLARQLLHTSAQDTVRIGVGFLCWLLDKSPSKGKELLDIALASRVQAIWLSFGEDIGAWVNYVREHDPRAGSADAVMIFVQISTVAQALAALKEWKADVIVAQGNEAGGHGLSAGLPLFTLFPLIASLVPERDGPPILAAGGVATGAQVAALLALGASGVVLGTRFLLSPESRYTDGQRRALLDAESTASVRTMAFDYARNTLGWPKGIDGRGLRNATVDDYDRGEDITIIREKFEQGLREDDSNRILVWGGSGVGLMSQIKPAMEIVKELHEECTHRIKYTAGLLNLV